MFYNLKRLIVKGVVYSFEETVFVDLKLNFITLAIENLRDFWHADSASAWMKHLNTHVSSRDTWNKTFMSENMLTIRVETPKRYNSFTRAYEYPDADFCLFRHFPHGRLVFTTLIFHRRVSCTCTMHFLLKENHMASNYLNNLNNLVFSDKSYLYYYNYLSLEAHNESVGYCRSKLYNTTMDACDLEKMLSNCDKSKFNSNTRYIIKYGVYFWHKL